MRKALIATGILAMMGAVAAASPSGASTRHSAGTAAHHKVASPKAPAGTTLLATFTAAPSAPADADVGFAMSDLVGNPTT